MNWFLQQAPLVADALGRAPKPEVGSADQPWDKEVAPAMVGPGPRDKRRLPRQTAGWTGRYRFQGDGDAGQESWHSCEVIEISGLGSGVELLGPVPEDIMGRLIIVEIEPTATTDAIRLIGEIRDRCQASLARGVRVGIEFVALSPLQRSILGELERLQLV